MLPFFVVSYPRFLVPESKKNVGLDGDPEVKVCTIYRM